MEVVLLTLTDVAVACPQPARKLIRTNTTKIAVSGRKEYADRFICLKLLEALGQVQSSCYHAASHDR